MRGWVVLFLSGAASAFQLCAKAPFLREASHCRDLASSPNTTFRGRESPSLEPQLLGLAAQAAALAPEPTRTMLASVFATMALVLPPPTASKMETNARAYFALGNTVKQQLGPTNLSHRPMACFTQVDHS